MTHPRMQKDLLLFCVYDSLPAHVLNALIVCPGPTENRRGCQMAETEVSNSCEMLCGCWELNTDSLEEYPEPPLQPL